MRRRQSADSAKPTKTSPAAKKRAPKKEKPVSEAAAPDNPAPPAATQKNDTTIAENQADKTSRSDAHADDTLRESLAAACADLYYPSESDEPLNAFLWQRTTPTDDNQAEPSAAEILHQAKQADDAPVKEITLEDFFARGLKVEDWYGAEEKATVEKFGALKDLLEKSLKHIKVFRVGETEIDVYVVGITENKNLAGIQTKVVET